MFKFVSNQNEKRLLLPDFFPSCCINLCFISIFQIEFKGEEGTGLGPTLEFYALVAAELQKKSHGLWLCDDDHVEHLEREVCLREGWLYKVF